MGKWNGLFTIPAVLLLAVFITTNLLASQADTNKPLLNRSAPQSETRPQPRLEVQNLSPAPTGAQLQKSEVIQKTNKLQMPFIANNGQMDEKVKFYANTFGGTVFITKDGDIVYALPNSVAHASPLVHYDIDKNETGYTGLTGFPGKEGQCIVHRTLCALYPYCPWNVSVYYSETNSPLKRGTHPFILFREGNRVCNTTSTTRRDTERRVPATTVALKEEFIGAKIKTIQGEEKSVTNVNYFKGNNPSKWKTNISAYDIVNLGEVYKGIELKLKAYGNNVEKFFCVKPGADPEQIKVGLSSDKDCGMQNAECGKNTPLSPLSRGDKSEFGNPILPVNTHGEPDVGWVKRSAPNKQLLLVNEHGELEFETELGPVKFTKPVAYQEIDGKRVAVECGYVIADCGMKDAECKTNLKPEAVSQRQEAVGWVKRSAPNKNGLNGLNQLNGKESRGKSQMSSREKGMGRKGKYLASNQQLPIQNSSSTSIGDPKLIARYSPPIYSFTVASYDKTKDLIIDPLLASTYLGGSNYDYSYSLALDTSGNVYVMGYTESTNFPTTNGAYDTSLDGDYTDVFVSKLDGGLTYLLASTYLGGTHGDEGQSITLDTSGNVYVAGSTYSTDFPTTNEAYDTSYASGGSSGGDVFVSKLDSGLSSLLASTFLGGSNSDHSYSLALDKSGNIYVTGYTYSTDFPTTNEAYAASFNGVHDVFVSKLDSGLTSLQASTYLGGSGKDYGYSLTFDTNGNVYVTGYTMSSDFPMTSGAYDTSRDGEDDVFVSKLDGGLTSLLASTYLGGSNYDRGYSLTLGTSENIYVTGETGSTDFPTTSEAHDRDGEYDVFVSKLNVGLTSLQASTYLGGSDYDYGYAITLDPDGNVYITGETGSTDFPTTSGAYDTSYNGGNADDFISKLDSGLTRLLASTYLGGSSVESGYSLTLDTNGNVYVTGKTWSTDFPTTSDAYDTSYNGGRYGDVFISKLDGYLSAPPTASTGSATNVTTNSATLDGVVNANGLSTTAWFEYGTYNGSYTSTSSIQSVSGTTATILSININGLSSGTTYFYRIVAQSSAGTTFGIEKSFKTSVDTTKAPVVTTGLATNVTSNAATLNGTVNANGLETYAWFDYSTTSGTYGNVSLTQSISGSNNTTVNISISGLKEATTYYYRIAAQNNSGTSYGSEKSFATSDITAPSGSISINEGDTYTNSTTVTLALSAIDNLGVTGYYLSTSSTTPSASAAGWTSVTSTTSYSANVSYILSSMDGIKTVYVWYKDNSGNVSSSASDSILLDMTVPTILITSPTSDATYTTTSSVMAIGGSASDITSGISSVTWSNDNGGSGTTSGTTSWLTSSIALMLGDNIITITATDGAGNTGTDSITVTFATGTIITPTQQPSPTPLLTPTTEPTEKGIISGYVINKQGYPIESAKIRLKGKHSKVFKKTISDEDGLFEFADLDADTYIITVLKKGYKRKKKTITLEAGEEKDIEIVMKRTSRK